MSRWALARDLGINVVAPYATYLLLRHEGVSLVWSLAAGSVFPIAATWSASRAAGGWTRWA